MTTKRRIMLASIGGISLAAFLALAYLVARVAVDDAGHHAPR